MKLKNFIDILGTRWKIKKHKVDIVYEGRTVEGLCIPCDKDLHIRMRDKDTTTETFFHEAGHGLFDALGLNQTSIHPDLQEIIVEGYSKFLIKNFVIRFK